MYGFTGEPTDGNELLYLRARYYAPNLGVFTGLDPWEGTFDRAMSLNGYSWVEGNVPNRTDPSGMIYETPYMWGGCYSGQSQNEIDASCNIHQRSEAECNCRQQCSSPQIFVSPSIPVGSIGRGL